MSYLSLYRKWRPATFTDVLGQDHVTETLVGALRDDRVAHAYVFSGPRGTGKTSTARILAKALNCESGPTAQPCGKCGSCLAITEGSSLDVYEMDAASHTSVDDVREIRDRIPFASAGAMRKVYIIDEAHQLSTAAFNALLKMLEEPPPHVVFVLCTTESHKLPATVVSRCQRFEFRRITDATIAGHLGRVAESEEMKAEPDALALIARHAHGSARDALALLDQAAGTADGIVSRSTVVSILGEAPLEVLFALSDAIQSSDVTEVFRQVDSMVASGWDPRSLLRQLLEHFRGLFLVANGASELAELSDADLDRYREHAVRFTRAHLEWVIRVLGEAQADVRASTHPRLALEVTLARAAVLETDERGALAARVERLERLLIEGGGQTLPSPPASAQAPSAPREQQPPPDPQPQPSPAQASDANGSAASEPSPEPESAPEPEPPVQEPREPVPDPSGAGASHSDLEGQWKAVLDEVRSQSKVTYTHLVQGQALEIRDDGLVVMFPAAFHAEQLSKRPEQLARVVGAIGKVFGRKLRFLPEVGQAAPVATTSAGSAADPSEGGQQQSPDELLRASLGAEPLDEGGK